MVVTAKIYTSKEGIKEVEVGQWSMWIAVEYRMYKSRLASLVETELVSVAWVMRVRRLSRKTQNLPDSSVCRVSS
jgi:hypothetical protein